MEKRSKEQGEIAELIAWGSSRAVDDVGDGGASPHLGLCGHGARLARDVVIDGSSGGRGGRVAGVALLAAVDVAPATDAGVANGGGIASGGAAEVVVKGEGGTLAGGVDVASTADATEEASGRCGRGRRGLGGSGWLRRRRGGDGRADSGGRGAEGVAHAAAAGAHVGGGGGGGLGDDVAALHGCG
jgi:hypothetical protein